MHEMPSWLSIYSTEPSTKIDSTERKAGVLLAVAYLLPQENYSKGKCSVKLDIRRAKLTWTKAHSCCDAVFAIL
jgi:hypothetical protein